MYRRSVAAILLITAAFMTCSCSGAPTKKDAEKFVDRNVPEPAHFVKEKDGTFIFESDLRDLQFEVTTYEAQTGFGGTFLEEHYAEAVREYYEDQLDDVLSDCRCCDSNTDGDGFVTFYIDDDEDAQDAARAIAECNEIVADQFEYTPDEDLTDLTVMGIRFYILPYSMLGSNLDYPRLDDHRYILNGEDDADDLYDLINDVV